MDLPFVVTSNIAFAPMSHHFNLIRLLVVPLLMWIGAEAAQAQPTQPLEEYVLYEERGSAGSHIRQKAVLGSRLPFQKKFSELNEAQKGYLRSFYEKMPEADEPPYPKYGLIDIYSGLMLLRHAALPRGEVEMYVTVSSAGKPLKVDVFKTPDPQFTEIVATQLMSIEYKPAVCGGKPCTMEFPFLVTFSRTP